MSQTDDRWQSANAYDQFMGRWSRLVAEEFIQWLEPASHLRWVEMGCGTGALTRVILSRTDPASILAFDPSKAFVELARAYNPDPRAVIVVGNAENIPSLDHGSDVFVSGLVLNFVEDPPAALDAGIKNMDSTGLVGCYVWDYAGKMEYLRTFWDAAVSVDHAAQALDEGRRFPLCAPGPLQTLFENAGLVNIEVTPLLINTSFEKFDDYWEPFLGGTGPAPAFVQSLSGEKRTRLEDEIQSRLIPDGDGSFDLIAGAWAVKGRVAD